jgi:hypothetical protein
VVEPVSLTLGAIVAAMVRKAAETTAEQAVEGTSGVVGRMVGWLRNRFSDAEHSEGSVALARLEDAPDSPTRVRELARIVDQYAEADPGLRAELEALVKEARTAGVDVGSITQSAWGNQNVQAGGVVDSEIAVTYGTPPPRPGT